MFLNHNLKQLMLSRGINGNQLAIKTGIAQPIIHRLLTGQNINPKLKTIRLIACYFNVTVSQLIGEEALSSMSV